MSDLHAGFQQPSATALLDRLHFLDQVDTVGHIRAIKDHMREQLRLQPGNRVVEAGCGAGHELVRLAAAVGPGGAVLGFDLSAGMVAEARRRIATPVPPASPSTPASSVQAVVGDARQLALPTGWADAVRAERVLKYIPDAERAIAELVRVTRPGGRVAVYELDYGATMVDLPDQVIAGQVLEIMAAAIPRRWMGRSLGRLFHDAGLQDIVTAPFPVRLPYPLHLNIVQPALEAAVGTGSLDAEAYKLWLDASRHADQAGHHADTFFGLAACGTKPG